MVKRLANARARPWSPTPAPPRRMTKILRRPRPSSPRDIGRRRPQQSSTRGPQRRVLASNGGLAPRPSNTPSGLASRARQVNEKTSLPMIANISAPGGLQMMIAQAAPRPTSAAAAGSAATSPSRPSASTAMRSTRSPARSSATSTQHRVVGGLDVRRVGEHAGRPERGQEEVRPGRQRAQDQHPRRHLEAPTGPSPRRSPNVPAPGSHAIVGFGDGVHFELEKPTDRHRVHRHRHRPPPDRHDRQGEHDGGRRRR